MRADFPEIAFYSYVFAPTGYGTAARGYVHAFYNAGIPFSVVSLDRFPNLRLKDPLVMQRLADGSRRFAPAVHLWHTEPQHVMRLERNFDRLAVMTTWETDSLPLNYVKALNHAAEVWVPSRYNEQNFARQLSVPVFRMPHPVNALVAPRYDRESFEREMNLPPKSFLCVAVGTWQERKNLDGAVEAFLRAFPRNKDAYLFIKTSFAFIEERTARAQIAAAIARAQTPDPEEAEKRICVFPHNWPEDCLSSLLHRADCYLSLHRGEGWCYPLFDAASIGVPVVATGYSGPLDYLRSTHHRLVGYKLTAANQQKHTVHFFFDSSMSWAEPDRVHAAEQLRAVYENRMEARRLAAEAAVQIQKEYSLESVGQTAGQRFAAINEQALRMNPESPFAIFTAQGGKADLLQTPTRPDRVLDSPSSPLVCN